MGPPVAVTRLPVCVSAPVVVEGTSTWPPLPVSRLAACHHSGGHRGDLGAADCPHHPPRCVSLCRWPQRGSQRGHRSLSPTSPRVSEPVAVEGTSAQLPVPVTRLPVCHRPGDLSVATCGHHPLPCLSAAWWLQRGPLCGCLSLSPTSLCVTVSVAAEGTSAWLPVPVTCLHVCHSPGGCGGDFGVAACPCHPSHCVSPSWWPQRGP